MDYSVRRVSLSEIDTTDRTFRITTNSDYADLVPAIKGMGLLQPPLLAAKGKGYIVVSGFRRIAACQAIPLNEIPARITNGHLPGILHAQMAIADNGFQRPLNVVEQSRALALIRRFAPNPADWQAIAQIVGLPNSQAGAQRLLPIADMPESLQMAIVNGSIALPVALSITKLKNKDADILSTFLQRINTGLNNQRELLELIVEMSIIKKISIAHVLEQEDIATILDEEDASMPQRVQRLRQVLKKMRYPALSEAEDAFLLAFKALGVNSVIQLHPPRFFEGKTFRLSLSIRSRQQLKSLLTDLEKIANDPDLLPE